MWTAAADPCVLRVRVSSATGLGARGIDVSRWQPSVVHCDGCTHVRLHLPDGVLRLDLVDGTVRPGPMTIEPPIDLRRAIDPQIASLRRLDALKRGDILATRHQRIVRLVAAQRAPDPHAAGASPPDIGAGALSGTCPGHGARP